MSVPIRCPRLPNRFPRLTAIKLQPVFRIRTAAIPHGASNEPLNTVPTGNIGFVGGADISPLFTHLERNPALVSSSLQHSPRSEAWSIRLRDGVSKNETGCLPHGRDRKWIC